MATAHLVVACDADSHGPASDVSDAQPNTDVTWTDGDTEAGGEDSTAPASDTGIGPTEPAEPPALALSRLHLSDGSSTVGELIASYNHNYWWDEPGNLFTYALFDPTRYAAWPDDRSLELVASDGVERITVETAAPAISTYRAFARSAGLIIDAVPLRGVVHVITGNDSYHLEENGFGDFAWDLVLTDPSGARFTGDGTRNEDYLVWDAEVRLPNAGLVVEVEREAPDNAPGQLDLSATNNLVGIHLGGAFYLYFLHFRQGSVPDAIVAGQTLEAGTLIGHVGNSGVSVEPHLHMTVLWFDEEGTGRSWSVPSEWRDLYTAPSPSGPVHFERHAVPQSRTWIASDPW